MKVLQKFLLFEHLKTKVFLLHEFFIFFTMKNKDRENHYEAKGGAIFF